MDVFEAINTQRAMRRLKPDPVPDELIWKVAVNGRRRYELQQPHRNPGKNHRGPAQPFHGGVSSRMSG